VSESNNAEVLLEILNQLPGAPWSFRLDPGTGTAEWTFRSPQLAETYALTDAEIQGSPLALIGRLPPDEAAALQQRLAASLATLAPMGWTERVVLATGEVRWVETRARFLREAAGTILAFGQSYDVTEQKRAEHLYREALDALPAVVFAMTPEGKFPIYNRAAQRFVGSTPELQDGDLKREHGMFRTDGITPLPKDESPLVRALRGEEAPSEEVIVRNGSRPGNTWIQIQGAPIRDETGRIIAGLVISQDLTAVRLLEQELRARNAQLSESEESKLQLIDRLRGAVEELSNPILEIWDDVLAMPIIGIVDSRRTADMVQRLLVEVARTQASFVIVDLTGVEIVDTKTADHLIKLIRKVELVGARCVLTGIRPAVSETLVDIGVDFGRITTLRNLKHGLREALRHARREREGTRDAAGDDGDEPGEAPRARASAPRPAR
jgi:rsbT co-antagonist protein RsbR